MLPTLMAIQKAIPADNEKAGASKPTAPASARPAAKWAKPVGDKPSVSESNSFACDISSGIHVFADGTASESWRGRLGRRALLNAIGVAKRFDGPVTIWCDSQYCVNGVNDWRHKWKRHGWKKSPNAKERVKNPDLWKGIDEAMTSAA